MIKLAKSHTSHLIYKKNRSRKNGDKDKEALFKLMSNVVYGETMKSLRNRVDARLVNNKKGYLKTKLRNTKVLEKDLVVIHKIKLTLALNKPKYDGICLHIRIKGASTKNFHYAYQTLAVKGVWGLD